MIYISNRLKTITLTRRGSFIPSGDTYSLLLTNNYSQFNCTIELEDTSENPKKFVFELTDEQFESLDFGEYNFVLMNGSDKVYAGMLRVMQEFEPDVVYQWSHGDQPEPEPVYYDVYIAAGENGHLLIDGETYTVYANTVLKGTRLTVEAVADNGYQINSWSDGSTADTRSFVVNSNVTLLVAFEAVPVVNYFQVNISAGNNGSVSVNGVVGNYNEQVEEGTVLTVVATPDQDYQFQGWSDGDLNQTRTITVTSNVTISATFEAIPSTMYWVNINSGANGQVSVNGVVGNYSQQVPENTILSIEAIPATGYEFVSWNDGNTHAQRNITVTGDVQLQSSYQIMSFTVSIASDDTNEGTVTVNGTTGDYSSTMTYGSLLSFSATPTTGYVFVEWSDGDTNASRITSVTSNITLTALFAVQTFNVSISGDAHTNVTVNGTPAPYTGTVNYGTQLSLVATPDTGYDFQGWSDGDVNTTRSITVTADTTLSCTSAIQTFSVSISAGNNGSVEVNGVSGNYSQTVNYGTVLTVEAVPNATYNFVSWSDGNSTNPRTITVTSNVTLTCSFEGNIQVLPNQIKYRSQSGNIINPQSGVEDSGFNELNIVSNTYQNGIGVIEYDGDIYYSGYELFKNETDLTEVYLPTTWNIGGEAFSGCTNLRKVETYYDPNGRNLDVNYGCFNGCTSLTRLVFSPNYYNFDSWIINNSGVNYLEIQTENLNYASFSTDVVENIQQDGVLVINPDNVDFNGDNWQGLWDNGWTVLTTSPSINVYVNSNSSTAVLAADYDVRDVDGNQVTVTDTYVGDWRGLRRKLTFSAEPYTINKLFDSTTGTRVRKVEIFCNSLNSIGSGVFQYCNNLNEIFSLGITAPTVQNDTFKGVALSGTLNVQPNVTVYTNWLSTSGYYLGWYGWNGLGNNAIIVKSSSSVGLRNGYLTDVNNNAITASLVENDGNGVYRIALSGTPAHIADSTVSGDDYGWLDGDRTDVSQVVWLNAGSLVTIGDNAFNGLPIRFDDNLTALTTIGDYAFNGATITGYEFITENITSIGTGAFLDAYNNTGSGEFWITGTFTEIPEDALNFNKGVWLKIHSRNISDIGANAFGNASELMFTAVNTATVNDYDQGMFSSKFNGYTLAVPGNQYTDVESAYPGNRLRYLPTMYYTTYNGQPAYEREGGQWRDNVYSNGSGVAIVDGNVSDNVSTVTDFYGEIGDNMFDDCYRLTTFNFTHVTSIGSEPFDNSGITNIAIPAGCTSIGYGLARTNTVTSVTVDGNNPNYYALDNCLIRKSDYVCIYCPAIANPPEGVIGFDGWVMSGTGRVIDLVIPRTFDGLTDSCCFYENCNIPNVIFTGDPTNITGEFDDGTFRDNNTPCWVDEAYYNDCVTRWPDNNWRSTSAIYYTSNDNNVVTPYSTSGFGGNMVSNTYSNGEGVIKFDAPVTAIGSQGFYQCTSLETIQLPVTATNINAEAFRECTALTSIRTLYNVTIIGGRAFLGCSRLLSVDTTGSVTTIGYSAFEDCIRLSTVTIGDNVTTIQASAFKGCYYLTSIRLGESVTVIGASAFEGCQRLVKIHSSANTVPTVGTDAFKGIHSGGVFTFDKNLDYTTDKWLAFNNPKTDPTISLADKRWNGMELGSTYQIYNEQTGVTTTFYALEYVTWNQIANVGANEFYKKKDLAATIVGNTRCGTNTNGSSRNLVYFDKNYDKPVVKIVDGFYNCTNLWYPNFDNNIAVISGDSAFYNCNAMHELTLPDSCTLFNLSSLRNCPNLHTLTIGKYISYVTGRISSGTTRLNVIYFRSTEPPHSDHNDLFTDVASSGTMYVPTGSNMDAYNEILPSGWTLSTYTLS